MAQGCGIMDDGCPAVFPGSPSSEPSSTRSLYYSYLMPRIKGSIQAHLRLLFHRPSSSPDIADGDGPETSLQAHPDTVSDAQHPDAPAQSQPVPSTAAPTAAVVPPTVEETKANAKVHSRAFKVMVTTFESFTVLAKLVEPFLQGTPFQAPVAVFTAIAEGIEKLKDTREGAEDTMDSLSARMRDIAQHYGDSRSAESRSMLQEYSKELVSAAQNIDAILNLPWLGQLGVDANKSRLGSVIKQIEQGTNRFQIRVLLSIERDTKDIIDVLFKSTLQRLNRAPSAIYRADVAEGQSKRVTCTEGTRVETLQRITEWVTDSSSPSIFWLSGMAGSGKSTIAHTVCQQFSQCDTTSRATLGASFFCSRQVPELRRLGNIVPTLAYQLSHHSRSFATVLKDTDLDVVHVSGEQVNKLLLAPWAASESARSDSLPSTLIVIDALDEIDDDKGAELLQSLIRVTNEFTQSLNNVRKLKILVTSRPHPHIVNASGQLSRDAVYRLESIKKKQGRHDILMFLKTRLHDLTPKHSDLLERLADHADGLFIYAATVARILSSKQASLEMTTKEKLKWLSRFINSPTTSSSSDLDAVHGLYRQVLEEAIPERLRSDRLPILHRIICTQQPLSVDALAHILDLDPGDDVDRDVPALLVKALHAVLYISDVDSCVYVYHKSFSDFMLDRRTSGTFACDIVVQDTGIARACLRIMQTSLRFNMCNLDSSYLLDSEVLNLAESIEINVLNVPCLEYACRYWMAHLTQVPTSAEGVWLLCGQLFEFTNENVLFWLEVVNLLKTTLNITDQLRSLSAWVSEQEDAPINLKSTLTTVERLAEAFFWTRASASTPHLYISCLATMYEMFHDLPNTWKSHFAKMPQLSCTEIPSQGRVLTNIDAKSWVGCVAYSPDGTRIASGSCDYSVRIWDASTGAELQKLDGHTSSAVNSVAFSPDGTQIVSSSNDAFLHVWDALTGEKLQTLDAQSSISIVIDCVAFSPSGTHIVSGSSEGLLRVWDASTGAELKRIEGHTGRVSSVAFSVDGTRIASSSWDESVRIWDASTGTELQKIDGHAHPVSSVAFSPDGVRIVSGSRDKSVRIWDVSTGAELQKLDGHAHPVSSVAFSPDGTRVGSGALDCSLRIWDLSTGAELQKFDGHSRPVTSVAFSPDGTRIVSGSSDASVKIWDASNSAKPQQDRYTGWIRSVAFSPDGTRVVSGSQDCSVRIWDALTGAELQKLDGHVNGVNSVAFSPDGTRIVSGSSDNSVYIWDASTGAKLQKLATHTDPISSVAYSPDGTRIVSGSWDKSVRIWNASDGAELHKLDGHTEFVTSVAFSPDGTRVVSDSSDGFVRVWDASSCAELHKLAGHTNWVGSVAFSPDGLYIVAASSNKSVCTWDASTGTELHKFDGHTSHVASLAFSPDGARIVSGFDDKSVRIWDASTGVELQKLDGHTDFVNSVAFSPDGTRVVSGSDDGSIRIWNTVAAAEQEACQWRLDTQTGWIVSASSGARLLSVPAYLHVGLYDGRACTLVINRDGCTRVDFSSACIGPDWSKCYL